MSQLTGTPSFDGHCIKDNNVTWNDARDATTSDSVSKTDTFFYVRAEVGFHIARPFLTFDLSSIPAAATITSATLRIEVTATTAADAAHGELNLLEGAPASDSDLVSGDIDGIVFTSFGTVAAHATGTKTYTINSTGITYLQADIGGNTTLAMCSKKDFDDTQPSGAGLMTISSVDHGTAANRPLLTVNYTAPTGNVMFFSSGLTVG